MSMSTVRIEDRLLREAFCQVVGGYVYEGMVVTNLPQRVLKRRWAQWYGDYRNNIRTRMRIRGLKVVK